MKFFVICLLASVITGSSAVFFKKFTNSHCKCIPKNYPCFRKGYRINFNLGRLPSACLPGLILCCDEGITAFADSEESSSNKLNYKFNGSPRSSSKITNKNNKLNIPGSETILVRSLSGKFASKMALPKTDINRNLKILKSGNIPTTSLTKILKNVTRDLSGSKELEINEFHTSRFSHDKSSNITNLFTIFKPNSTRNISNEFSNRNNLSFINIPVTDSTLKKVIRNKSAFPNHFPSSDSTTNVHFIDMVDNLQRKIVTVNNTNSAIVKNPNTDIIQKEKFPYKLLNSNNLPNAPKSESVNFEKLNKHADITTVRPIVRQLAEVSIPVFQKPAEVINISSITLLAEEVTIPSVATPAEGGTMPSFTTMADVVIPPSVTSLVVKTNFKSLAEEYMPSTTPLAEVVTMPSPTLTEDPTVSSPLGPDEEVTKPSTTQLAEVTMPSNTTLAEVTMSSIKPLASMSKISPMTEIMLSITPLTEDQMPSTTKLTEVTILGNTSLTEEVTMFGIEPLIEITMPTTSTDEVTPITTSFTEDTMPSVRSLNEEERISNVTPLTEVATMLTVASLTEEATMISVTSLDEETTTISVIPLNEGTILSVTSLDEEMNEIVNYAYANEVKDFDLNTNAKQFEYENQSQTYSLETTNLPFSVNTLKGAIPFETPARDPYSTKFSKYIVNPRSKDTNLLSVYNESVDELLSFAKTYQILPHNSKIASKSSSTTDANLFQIMGIDMLENEPKKIVTESDGSDVITLNKLAESKLTMMVKNVTNSSLPITKNKPSILPKDVDEAREDLNLYSTTETTYYADTTIPQTKEKESNSVFNWLFSIF